MDKIDISVVLCTYNRSEMLRQSLETMISQKTEGKFSYEIVVIDDGSTDQTKDVVEEIARHSIVPLKYVKKEGKGYTHAMNRGITESSGEWLAFFDDDQLAADTWLQELFTVAMETGAHLVGGRRELMISEVELSALGPYCREILGEHPSKARRNPPLRSAGGNLLLKRTVIDSIGIFDEYFLTGGCDLDLVLRALSAGFVFGWAPLALVQHVILPDRIKPDKIIWYTLQIGCAMAYIDWKRWGRWKTGLACIARIGQALLVNLPLCFLHYINSKGSDILDRKARLWRAVAYTRMTLNLFSPWLFPQRTFLGKMKFRARGTSNTSPK